MNTTEQIKEVVIKIPEGYVIDKEKSTFTKIVFKKIQKVLPKTWGELERVRGYYVTSSSCINAYGSACDSSAKNTVPTKELANAILALCQLLQLRDFYNDSWVANWTELNRKFCIEMYDNAVSKDDYSNTHRVLHFKTRELRDEFLENFKDLIEIAKPLI